MDVRAAPLHALRGPFDSAYGLTGGEDGDLLARLVQGGARIVWCDESVVTEPVEPKRLKLRWLLLRALRGGQEHARRRLASRYGRLGTAGRVGFVQRATCRRVRRPRSRPRACC
jgi:succinoglycan biosynthesis protein ExoM